MAENTNRSSYRKSTSINNFIPPSMTTNLPSLNRYYSLNRNGNINNLDMVSHNNRNNLYCTMSHRASHNVRLIVPPTPSPPENININTYNVSSTSDYNTISVTDTSDQSSDHQALIRRRTEPSVSGVRRRLERWASLTLFVMTIISPVVMISLPKMEIVSLKLSQLQCGVGCEGTKISIIFKLILLSLACWALLYRPAGVTLPKVSLVRSALVSMLVLVLAMFWTVYSLQLSHHRHNLQYEDVVELVSSLVTCLLYLHYLSLLLLLLRPSLSSGLLVHVIRGEDGASRYFNIGKVSSLQEAASEVVTSYYQQFSPPLEAESGRHSKHRAHLVTATEETFARLENSGARPSPYHDRPTESQEQEVSQVATAIFPSIYKHLLKYLKSRPGPSHHTMDSMMQHLVTYIKYGMSPQSFLAEYLTTPSVAQVRIFLTFLNFVDVFLLGSAAGHAGGVAGGERGQPGQARQCWLGVQAGPGQDSPPLLSQELPQAGHHHTGILQHHRRHLCVGGGQGVSGLVTLLSNKSSIKTNRKKISHILLLRHKYLLLTLTKISFRW